MPSRLRDDCQPLWELPFRPFSVPSQPLRAFFPSRPPPMFLNSLSVLKKNPLKYSSNPLKLFTTLQNNAQPSEIFSQPSQISGNPLYFIQFSLKYRPTSLRIVNVICVSAERNQTRPHSCTLAWPKHLITRISMDHCVRVSSDGILSNYEPSFMFKQIFRKWLCGSRWISWIHVFKN